MDNTIVYFGNDWSAENRTSSHHIARRLAQRVPLLYVETPGIRPPKATGRDLRKIGRKLASIARAPRQVGPQMWLLTLPQIPFRRLPFSDAVNTLLGTTVVKRALRRLGFRRPISWFVVPHPGVLAGRLGEALVVYYCVDDYAALPDVDTDRIAQLDDSLTRRADQLFVVSARLIESKRKINPTALHSPHGVDVEMFRKASDPSTPVAEGAAALPHPVIGFFGLIEAWIDLELVHYLAAARPDWTFLLIGRLAVPAGELARLPNVVFPGPQPYEELPKWARAFDAAIIPYRLNRQVLNANPLKLREYLATGKPIVSVPAPEVERFARWVRIANSRDEFLAQLEQALADDSPQARADRIQAVAAMSWDARVQEILAVVEDRLREREGKDGDS